MNRHEKFVEELRKTYYKDIMADTRLTINTKKMGNNSEADIKASFESLYDDVFDDDDDD